MGKTVKIGAISVFFATLAGAELGGILGALLAIPVAAVVNIVVQDLLAERKAMAGEKAGVVAGPEARLAASEEPPLPVAGATEDQAR